jgi:hypothetical protein
MKSVYLICLLAVSSCSSFGQLVGYAVVDVWRNPPVVDAFDKLESMLAKKYAEIIRLQLRQNQLSSSLNRSIGDWGIGGPSSARLQEATLTQDYTTELGSQVVFDTNTKALRTFRTAANQEFTIEAIELDDFAQLDRTGQRAQSALQRLATEIKATNAEVAQTYADMLATDPGGPVNLISADRIPDSRMSQQKYEKLRGKMQALNLHLQDLQAQQRAVFALLQSHATLTRSKQTRDAEIAAQIQKANHVEQVRAISDLKFDNLRWH